MRSIYIAIPDDAADKLRELARREFRAPRQQAAVLVLAGLRHAGLNPGRRYDEDDELSVAEPDHSRPASDTGVGTDALDGTT
jgi:hypothetical protein